MEKQISILKVAISGGMFLKTSYKEHLPNSDERNHSGVSCTAPVHDDLAKAFSLLTPHLALICEQITNEEFIESIPEEYDSTVGYSESSEMGEAVSKALKAGAKKIKKQNLLGTEEKIVLPTDKYQISEVEFRFHNGIESISLAGSKELSTLDWMGIKSPAIKITGDYKYKDDLFQLSELLKYEVQEYLVNNKYAPVKQTELEFNDGLEMQEEQF